MEKMNHLRDLLTHEIQDLYSVEEQIIEAMPAMISKAKTPALRQALEEHLRVTERQKQRLDKVKQLMGTEEQQGERKGLFGLFSGGKQKCVGMEGIIKEGQRVMAEDMEPSVLEAAIVAAAQKIEHYEICGYGTARAYARELNLGQVAELLEETLDEEYEADDRLTDLAVGRLNEEAKAKMGNRGRGGNNRVGGAGRNKTASRGGASRKAAGKKSSSKKSSSKKSAGKKSAGKKGAAKKGAAKKGGASSRSTAAKKGGRATAGKKRR